MLWRVVFIYEYSSIIENEESSLEKMRILGRPGYKSDIVVKTENETRNGVNQHRPGQKLQVC